VRRGFEATLNAEEVSTSPVVSVAPGGFVSGVLIEATTLHIGNNKERAVRLSECGYPPTPPTPPHHRDEPVLLS